MSECFQGRVFRFEPVLYKMLIGQEQSYSDKVMQSGGFVRLIYLI